jgi:dipeptidyl aminopeptidase/acylaminoacyl peptidase
MRGDLNIPWFTSRDYFVFIPDINYVIPYPGKSLENSVLSGISHLCMFPYIDSTAIGLQGHSWGGYETNYLIAHSNIFKAAVEANGASDFIRAYGSVFLKKKHLKFGTSTYEPGGQHRIGSTMWDDLAPYINNSPIFTADKVNTPLLIVHHMNDDVVLWEQGLELFLALRRLDKNVWMLQYNNGSHGLTQESDKKDLSTRITQFFDYYLKASLEPKWMKIGIPAQEGN